MTVGKNTPNKKVKRAKCNVGDDQSQNNEINESKSREQLLAEIGLSPTMGNALAASAFAKSSVGNLDPFAAHHVMSESVSKVLSGDTDIIEATLIAQAITLDKMFTDLARRAAANMGQYDNAMEIYMKLALKAQSQSRTTLQTLAEIKNPRPLAFVSQANIAHGPQQVNNGNIAPRAENIENRSNELLEVNNGERLDTGTAGAASGLDTNLETMGTVDRTSER